MADKKHLSLIRKGVDVWNTWREEHPRIWPNLSGADLTNAELSRASLHFTDLSQSVLKFAQLSNADLVGANVSHADLNGADLSSADLSQADLRWTDLRYSYAVDADFRRADLSWATLVAADLYGVDLSGAIVNETNFSGAVLRQTTFGNTDLSTARGLQSALHTGPSIIGIDTLFRSNGKIPSDFLRGAGVPEDFILFVPSLVGRGIEFYSCFISYSHRDEEFAWRLHSRMRNEHLRVWYAPEDLKGGKKLHEEIFLAIQVHDKLLLVLSENSMHSEWVTTEIRRAKKVEREENRRKLFPIRLVSFDAIQKWECFDADSGKDLAVEVREYYIPDFSNWKDHDAFEKEFSKLLRDLRAT